MSFEEVFWVGDGFDRLDEHVVSGREVPKQLHSFYKTRVEIEKNYAKQLRKLANQYGVRDEDGSLSLGIEQTMVSLADVATTHEKFAQHLEECSVRQLHELRADLKNEQSKQHKVIHEVRTSLNKQCKSTLNAQNKFHRKCEATNVATYHKEEIESQSMMDPQQLEKAKKKAMNAERDQVVADEDYTKQVEATQRAQVKMEEFLVVAYANYAGLEKRRFIEITRILKEAVSAESEMTPALTSHADAAMSKLNEIDEVDDMAKWVNQNKTGSKRPEKMEYKDFSGRRGAKKGGAIVVAEYAGKYSTPEDEIAAVEDRMASEEQKMKGIEKMMGLVADASHKVRMEAEIKKFGETIEALAKHRAAICKSQGWDSGVQEEESYEEAAPAAAAPSAPSASSSRAPAPPAADAAPAGGDDEGEWFEAIYDYEAADEHEISLVVGDQILVTDKSDPEWWAGTLNDDAQTTGFFPSSYVQGYD